MRSGRRVIARRDVDNGAGDAWRTVEGLPGSGAANMNEALRYVASLAEDETIELVG